VQDEITEEVTIAIAPAIADAEQRRAMRKPPGSLDAWAAYQRGLWHLSKFTANDNSVAQSFFQQAIDLDPTFAGGYRGLGAAHFYAAAAFHTRSLLEVDKSMEALARRAVVLDGSDAEARSWLGLTLATSGDYEGALAETERALAMSPNLASAHGWLGNTLIWSGRPKEGLAGIRRYLRLDPRDPSIAVLSMQMAPGHYFCREYEAAIEAAKRVIRSYPDFPLSYLARRRARASWPDRGGRGGAEERDRDVASLLRHVRPRATTLVPAGRPCVHARRAPQGRIARGMTAIRRLAAVLAADVAGYLGLMGAKRARIPLRSVTDGLTAM
jgi:tetratricopeptide (TPR) repeat protein